MSRAFTLIELLFVIVIIAILSAMFIPKIRDNALQEAAIQLVSDIRYTQHLAMIDDKFNHTDINWYKKRWMIRFKENLVYAGSYKPNGTYKEVWSYTIFSDKSGDRNPNKSEIAKNPFNQNQYLSGGYNNTLHIEDPKSMQKLRLGSAYGVSKITFSGGCRSNILYLYFDYIGRPFNSMNTSAPYELASSGYHKLLTSACKIQLTNGKDIISIVIEPETGYVHIL